MHIQRYRPWVTPVPQDIHRTGGRVGETPAWEVTVTPAMDIPHPVTSPASVALIIGNIKDFWAGVIKHKVTSGIADILVISTHISRF